MLDAVSADIYIQIGHRMVPFKPVTQHYCASQNAADLT